MSDPEPNEIRNSILDYLSEHPDAEDTAEGIAEWWLLDRCIRRQLPAVRQALDDLVADGLLVTRSSPGRQRRFRINRETPPRPGGGDDPAR